MAKTEGQPRLVPQPEAVDSFSLDRKLSYMQLGKRLTEASATVSNAGTSASRASSAFSACESVTVRSISTQFALSGESGNWIAGRLSALHAKRLTLGAGMTVSSSDCSDCHSHS